MLTGALSPAHSTSGPACWVHYSQRQPRKWLGVFKAVRLQVYNEPVLNQAGQVYERAAVEQHLARHNTDPITGARLATKALTPRLLPQVQGSGVQERCGKVSNCLAPCSVHSAGYASSQPPLLLRLTQLLPICIAGHV